MENPGLLEMFPVDVANGEGAGGGVEAVVNTLDSSLLENCLNMIAVGSVSLMITSAVSTSSARSFPKNKRSELVIAELADPFAAVSQLGKTYRHVRFRTDDHFATSRHTEVSCGCWNERYEAFTDCNDFTLHRSASPLYIH